MKQRIEKLVKFISGKDIGSPDFEAKHGWKQKDRAARFGVTQGPMVKNYAKHEQKKRRHRT